jgi:hypothetical protein
MILCDLGITLSSLMDSPRLLFHGFQQIDVGLDVSSMISLTSFMSPFPCRKKALGSSKLRRQLDYIRLPNEPRICYRDDCIQDLQMFERASRMNRESP